MSNKQLTLKDSTSLGIRIRNDVLARITDLAKRRGISRNEWIGNVLIQATGYLPDGTIRKHSRKAE